MLPRVCVDLGPARALTQSCMQARTGLQALAGAPPRLQRLAAEQAGECCELMGQPSVTLERRMDLIQVAAHPCCRCCWHRLHTPLTLASAAAHDRAPARLL